MNQEQDVKAKRLAGVDAISAKAIALARQIGLVIERSVWDLGEDFSHEHAHRLDLFTNAKTVRLYFPDVELTKSDDDIRIRRTEERLKSAIAQLRISAPAATYSFL